MPAPMLPGTDQSVLGVLSLVVGIAVFSLQDLIIKLISDTYPVHQALTIRAVVALPLLFALVALGGPKRLKSKRAGLITLRGAVMFAAYTSFYLGLAALPLAVCVALYFVSPIFVTLLSALFLKEQVGARRWAAVFVGFFGVLIVLRPASDVFDPAALLPVFAGFSYAVSAVFARRLGATESASVMAFYANGVYLAAGLLMAAMLSQAGFSEDQHRSLAFLFRPWTEPTPLDFFLLAACGAIAAIGTVMLTQAYRLAQASTIAPYEYTALVWSLLYGWLAWGEFPDPGAWAGIALIVLAGLYTLSGATTASDRKQGAPVIIRPGESDG